MSVELRGEVGDGERGLVNLSFQDFEANFQKNEPCVTLMQITLRSLLMEDMLQVRQLL